MSLADVDGVQLYYERRGGGPSVLFVSGATGDAGHWTRVADVLADEYTIVSYDRRGNSRSPRPAGWATTTIEEQADDAAALLGALDLAPATVFATSAATGILASLCLRHPQVLRGAIFHEPVFPAGASNIDAVRAGRRAVIEQGMAKAVPGWRRSCSCATSPTTGSTIPSIHSCATGCWTTGRCCSGSRWRPTLPINLRQRSSTHSGFDVW